MSGNAAGPSDASAKISAEAVPRFSLPFYEGPLDLLLHLIKKAELDPRDVTASVVTDQYLKYLELLESLNLDVAGEYLVMAATLLLIKSFSMLPHPQPADTEEAEELRRDLIERLLEYQRYREAADKLGARPLVGRDLFTTPGESAPADSEPTRYEATVLDLVGAMEAVLRRLKDKTPRDIKLRDIPVAQCIPRVLAALDANERVDFISLFDDLEDRALVIATFMAVLELMKQQRACAWQERPDGPIWLGRGAAARSGLMPAPPRPSQD